MSSKYENYKRAKFALEGGELQDIYDVGLALGANVQPVHTFRGKGKPSGNFRGKNSAKLTFKSKMSPAGFERDYLGNYDTQKVIEGRLKLPGGRVVVITGTLDNLNFTSNDDGPVDFSVELIGSHQFAK